MPGLLLGCDSASTPAASIAINPESFVRTGSISERFLSYIVEMVELTRGRFWAPYVDGVPKSGDDRYQYRPPIDLRNRRLNTLAAALAPAYVRVSGTWANATWSADTDVPADALPDGYDAILTQQQWRGLVDFANAADADIVVSMATSPGARDASGVWQPYNARRLFAYTDRQYLRQSLESWRDNHEALMAAYEDSPAMQEMDLEPLSEALQKLALAGLVAMEAVDIRKLQDAKKVVDKYSYLGPGWSTGVANLFLPQDIAQIQIAGSIGYCPVGKCSSRGSNLEEKQVD